MKFTHNTVPVLFYSRSTIALFLVSRGKKPKTTLIFKQEFDIEQLGLQLAKLHTEWQKGSWRILIADELAYSLKMKLPAGLHVTRDYLHREFSKHVPDVFADSDWDFKILHVLGTGAKEVIAFAPVQEFWLPIKNLFIKQGLPIVATETEELAAVHHQDPVIGLALKKDVFGPDQDILNIEVLKARTRRKFVRFRFLLLILISGVAGIVVAILLVQWLARSGLMY